MNSVYRKRFTLIEILVVIGIIIILASITLSIAGLVNRKMLERRAAAQMAAIETALAVYKDTYGYFPRQTDAGAFTFWAQLKDESGNDLIDYEATGFISSGTNYLDPWGNNWFYECLGTMNPEAYDLWSMGPDGDHGESGVNDNSANGTDDITDVQGTNAASDDFTNWGVRK